MSVKRFTAAYFQEFSPKLLRRADDCRHPDPAIFKDGS
jgi:hypothetical protein